MKDLISLIGNTPLVEIQKLNPFKGVRIFGKLGRAKPRWQR